MNKKITTYFLSLIRKNEKRVIFDDGEYYWISDGYMMFKIHKDKFELNPKMFTELDLKEIISNLQSKEYKEAELYCFKPMKNIGVYGNGLYAEIISTDNIKACVKYDFLKYFKDCNFKVKKSSAEVVCTDITGDIIGCVMPIRIPKGEK